MNRDRAEQAWVYHFFLERQDGGPVPHDLAEELLDHIIAWVEGKGLQIGGGFRAPTAEEQNPEPFLLPVFTFITEKEGSTIIEQFRGADIREATLRWYRGSETKPGEPLLEIEEEATPITGCKGVWCISGHDPEDRFFLTHVVATKSPG